MDRLSVFKKELSLVEKYYQQNGFTNHLYLMYLYKQKLELNNLLWLICSKTQSNQTKPNPEW